MKAKLVSRNRDYGTFGEQEAKQFLTQQGYLIVAQNWRHGRTGELDLVAVAPQSAAAQPTLCFIEVKTRASSRFGFAEEALSQQKRQKLIRLAEAFLMHNTEWNAHNIRFDVIAIQPSHSSADFNEQATLEVSTSSLELSFYPNAFDSSEF